VWRVPLRLPLLRRVHHTTTQRHLCSLSRSLLLSLLSVSPSWPAALPPGGRGPRSSGFRGEFSSPMQAVVSGQGRDGGPVAGALTLGLAAHVGGRLTQAGVRAPPPSYRACSAVPAVHRQPGEDRLGGSVGAKPTPYPHARGGADLVGVGLAVVAFAAGQQVGQLEPDPRGRRLSAITPATAANCRPSVGHEATLGRVRPSSAGGRPTGPPCTSLLSGCCWRSARI